MGGGPSVPRVTLPRDHVIVVTGANTGIGYVMAKELAIMGAKVILACRSEQRATEAITQMKAEYESEKYRKGESHVQTHELQLEYMHLDLSSLQSTMAFIDKFKLSGSKLHVLLCNAGIAAPPWGHTEDGYEKQFQVNYLGHFLIIAHLLPIMQQSGDDCRIVLTSSEAQKYCRFDLATIQAKDEKDYARFKYYAKSKMYQVMHTASMAPRLRGSNVSMTCYHPGAIATEISRNLEDHWAICCLPLINCCLKSREKGARTGTYLATSPDVYGQTGGYYIDCQLKTPFTDSRNAEYQKQLWDYTMDCLKDLLPPDFT